MKTKHIILILFLICTHSFFAQKIIFTKERYFSYIHRRTTNYYVDGKEYHVYGRIPRIVINPTGLVGYYIGYDSAAPQKSAMYYNMPYFDDRQTKQQPVTCSGKLIYIHKNMCEYQFYILTDNGKKKLMIGHQAISNDEIKNNNVHPGACYKVAYLPQTPDASIIYVNEPASDNQVNWQNPALSKPNGLFAEAEPEVLFTQPKALNQYLIKYGQKPINSAWPLLVVRMGNQFKSGFLWNVALGGAPYVSIVKLGVGYAAPLNQRLYFSSSFNFTTM